MIKIININKKYFSAGIETVALDNITFSVNNGEFVAIMGPSGCGKSTLLNIMGLIDTPSTGQYFFEGKEVCYLSENKKAYLRRDEIGFVFQSFNLIDDLTVYENVELPMVYKKVNSSLRKKIVMEMLDKMNISHKKNFLPGQLSGGQQQKVAIARATISRPKLLLADEPTGNLDSVNGEDVMQILKQLNSNGTTILMVTHSNSYADYANRIIHLFDGHIVAQNFGGK